MVLVEGGVAWLAPLIWRLTDHWRSMRVEVPWMVRPPLEYRHRNVRLTTQPLENPDDPGHLAALLQSIDAQRMLMFSSDYRTSTSTRRLSAGAFPAPCCRRSCTTTPPGCTASVARVPDTVDDASARVVHFSRYNEPASSCCTGPGTRTLG